MAQKIVLKDIKELNIQALSSNCVTVLRSEDGNHCTVILLNGDTIRIIIQNPTKADANRANNIADEILYISPMNRNNPTQDYPFLMTLELIPNN